MKHLNTPQISFDRLRRTDEHQFDIRIATDGRWSSMQGTVDILRRVMLRMDLGQILVAAPLTHHQSKHSILKEQPWTGL